MTTANDPEPPAEPSVPEAIDATEPPAGDPDPTAPDSPVPDSPAPDRPPTTVVVSFWFFIASAAIKAFFGILTLSRWTAIVDDAVHNIPAGTTPAQMQSYVHSLLTVNVVLDLGFAAIFVLFAYLVRGGRNWARLTITVIVVVFGILNILTGADLYTIINVVLEAVGAGLLYTRTAKPFFARRVSSSDGGPTVATRP